MCISFLSFLSILYFKFWVIDAKLQSMHKICYTDSSSSKQLLQKSLPGLSIHLGNLPIIQWPVITSIRSVISTFLLRRLWDQSILDILEVSCKFSKFPILLVTVSKGVRTSLHVIISSKSDLNTKHSLAFPLPSMTWCLGFHINSTWLHAIRLRFRFGYIWIQYLNYCLTIDICIYL